MMTLQDFAKQRDFLVCVDSDGCAMDTMDVKHIRCFGPCLVREWGLEAWTEPILKRWNEINLYSMTRGINRFKALAEFLGETNAWYTPIEGVEELVAWIGSAPELSNAALAEAVKTARGPALAKALSWSKAVNAAIDALPESERSLSQVWRRLWPPPMPRRTWRWCPAPTAKPSKRNGPAAACSPRWMCSAARMPVPRRPASPN